MDYAADTAARAFARDGFDAVVIWAPSWNQLEPQQGRIDASEWAVVDADVAAALRRRFADVHRVLEPKSSVGDPRSGSWHRVGQGRPGWSVPLTAVGALQPAGGKLASPPG